MKITHPVAIRGVSLLISGVVRAWLATQDFKLVFAGEQCLPRKARGSNLYAFWHENILFPLYAHCGPGFSTLVSQHRDGELITQVIRMFRGGAVRGSTTRGSLPALRGMMRRSRVSNLAITPDGPRGPRRQVQPGAIYLASRMQMPLIPVGYAFANCWRAGSWDKMALPRPFQRARGVVGEPITVPADADRQQLEAYRDMFQKAMDDVQQRAENWAQGGYALDDQYNLRQLKELMYSQ